MPRPANRNLHLDVVTPASLIAQLKNLKLHRYARAEQNYLLCKARIRRRQQEIQEGRAQGNDVSNLERMVATLEQSKQAHRSLMQRLLDED